MTPRRHSRSSGGRDTHAHANGEDEWWRLVRHVGLPAGSAEWRVDPRKTEDTVPGATARTLGGERTERDRFRHSRGALAVYTKQ